MHFLRKLRPETSIRSFVKTSCALRLLLIKYFFRNSYNLKLLQRQFFVDVVFALKILHSKVFQKQALKLLELEKFF